MPVGRQVGGPDSQLRALMYGDVLTPEETDFSNCEVAQFDRAAFEDVQRVPFVMQSLWGVVRKAGERVLHVW